MPRKRLIVIIVLALVSATLIGLGVYYLVPPRTTHKESSVVPKPQAPPDLAKLRPTFVAGVEAVRHGDGQEAVKQLRSFDFGPRKVEEYRLYYLAQGHQLAGDANAARATLAKLWRRRPAFVAADDAGTLLGNLYAAAGDWGHAADAYEAVGAASARWSAVETRFHRGDIDAALSAARGIVIKSPRAPQVADALAFVRAVTGSDAIKLTPDERFERGVNLIRDGDPQNAWEELTALEPAAPAALVDSVRLQKGIALFQLRRFEESAKTLEPLTSKSFKYAIPALQYASRSYRALSASINPIVYKSVLQRKQVGTVKVRVGKGKKRKLVTKPKFAKVKVNVPLVDLAKKAKKDEYDRLATERLKDMLLLRLPDDQRVDVLSALIAQAEAKNQDPYERELVAKIVKLDPLGDPGLQHFWDKAWAAWARGDLNASKDLFRFVGDTYTSPNVRRAADYWYARTIERAGQKPEAMVIYRRLASAPYDDIYAVYSEQRGAPRPTDQPNPLTMNRPDWAQIAEQNMPGELRLAYELTSLTDFHDAGLELSKNQRRANQPYADALLSEIFTAQGNTPLAMRSLRRAFPALATPEQDSVPPYFLKMYYPIKYEESIKKYAKKNGLDPYLVMGLIHQESYFNPTTRSPAGAVGLMQLMPATGQELGTRFHGKFNVSKLQNPDTNIELGTYHLKYLINLFGGNTQLAIASYNAGQGRVAQWRRAAPHKPMDEFVESIPFRETRTYVKHVVMLESSYKRMAR